MKLPISADTELTRRFVVSKVQECQSKGTPVRKLYLNRQHTMDVCYFGAGDEGSFVHADTIDLGNSATLPTVFNAPESYFETR